MRSKLSDILKLVFKKNDAQSDSQILLTQVDLFRIHSCKNSQHFFSFVADLMLSLHFDERKEEFAAMNTHAFNLLRDIIVEQIVGSRAAQCEVTKQLVADIKARAPTTMLELFDIITQEGQRLHVFAVDCERRGIPFLPKRSDKDDKGNENKKARHDGGGGAVTETRTKCSSCGKYHLGTCDPNEEKEELTSHLPHPLRLQQRQ
jgi:hypothetical protein